MGCQRCGTWGGDLKVGGVGGPAGYRWIATETDLRGLQSDESSVRRGVVIMMWGVHTRLDVTRLTTCERHVLASLSITLRK